MLGKKVSRRAWLKETSSLAVSLPWSLPPFSLSWNFLAGQSPQQPPHSTLPSPPNSPAPLFTDDPTKYHFTENENEFLEEAEHRSFLFFWEETNPSTGLIKDRSLANGPDPRDIASIAATGFGLTALCIADSRGWLDGKRIRERVRNTLHFVVTRAPQEHGFFYHFLNMHTGQRVFASEVSSIDTAIFLCGVLTCRAHFEDLEIRELATSLYERVDWGWLLHGDKTLSMGWRPESGFIKARWDSYSELMMIYLLGLGSPTHPLPPETWHAWTRPNFEFKGIRFIGAHAPLFVHQFSHAWFDFRGKRDAYADYFQNSILATQVHKAWCLSLAKKFPDYAEDLWGITSSDSPQGYLGWGGPPAMGPIDGTVVPCAAGGSLPFLLQDSMRVLLNIRNKFGEKAWRRYGFVDAFNPRTNWYNPDVVGIDLGITLLMAENARTGFVWEQFMKNEEVKRGMARAGFKQNPTGAAWASK